ncbi:MAG: stage V sporulation protein AC [Eubacteriaceae bacterium]|nr:stage V sporulation protein AC [Eubacteriaceae bacterium]
MKSEEVFREDYERISKKNKAKPEYFKNAVMAFLVGGTICTLGQLIKNIIIGWGTPEQDAALITTIVLVFLGSSLTAFGIYDMIGRHAGAGSIVPITGFANSIVSCAVDFKTEGPVFGLGAKMFTIAGPVIVYATVSSWIFGLIYYLWGVIF